MFRQILEEKSTVTCLELYRQYWNLIYFKSKQKAVATYMLQYEITQNK